MKIQNMKISTRLRLALGVILMLAGILAWETVTQTEALWLQTKTMYDHPLQVRRAVGAFKAEVTAMHRDMRGLMLSAGSDQEIAALLAQIEVSKTDAFRQLDILEARYLGPVEDITTLRAEFVKWNTIREETIRLLRQGKVQEAAERTKPNEIGGAQVRHLTEQIHKVDEFARNKGDQIFQEATSRKNSLNQRSYLYAGILLFFLLLIAYVMVKWVRDPLKRLTAAADRFRQGDMNARSGYAFANEFGELAKAFDAMAETVAAEMQLRDKAGRLTAATARETEARAFCRALLAALVDQTGSQIGAVYLLNAQQTAFEHFESIGLGAGVRAAFSAETREGEFGAALATGQVQHITAIPDDTVFAFATVSGDFRPKEIITLPVLADHRTTAVISLASIRPYDTGAVRLVNEALATIAARLNGVLLFRKIQDLAGRLEAQNQELEAQKTELSTQTTELTAMNTELEAQGRELEQSSRLKSVFLANMSHELRTPLNSVIALSGVLNRRLVDKIPAEECGYLEIIERNGRHLLSLINDILDLSRIEAGREDINLGSFSVRELTDEVVEMLEPLAREKGLALVNRAGSDLPNLHSDPGKVRHILQNLAGNAVKFTETGSVDITARQAGDDLYIAVSDTGIGIPAEELPRIFEEFHQVDASASRVHGGTGLGLAIARKYARLLGGDIAVKSAPGQGSSFTLRLPLRCSVPDDSASAGDEEPRLPVAGHGVPTADPAGRRILLVEDSEAIVIQMTEMLAEQGYAVRTAKNGIEALARIEEELPDAVILDLMMPEMDGFAVLKVIRGTERSEKLPVLILTARQVTREELGFLRYNHIHQLIRKGDVRRKDLLAAVAGLVAPTTVPEPEKTPPIRRRATSGIPKVLMVEDTADNLLTLRALLKDTCTLLEALDGRSGVEQARHHQPDLILMDLALPVMDGYAALAAIRKDETLRDIPVVAVTASAMKGNRESILARGFDGYVSKPIDADMLKKTIDEVLHGKD
jgi:signal transduction histidine kinase/CheY-like chemotaxis protein/HAMP domain-containing protein